MNDIKKNKKKRYKKIVKQSKFWPIVQLFNDRNGFMNEVSQKSQKKILEKIKPEDLYDEIINTVYKEKLRISNISWKADPADDKKFWYSLKEKIVAFENDRNNKRIKDEILPIIIDRYTKEITVRLITKETTSPNNSLKCIRLERVKAFVWTLRIVRDRI